MALTSTGVYTVRYQFEILPVTTATFVEWNCCKTGNSDVEKTSSSKTEFSQKLEVSLGVHEQSLCHEKIKISPDFRVQHVVICHRNLMIKIEKHSSWRFFFLFVQFYEKKHASHTCSSIYALARVKLKFSNSERNDLANWIFLWLRHITEANF